MVKLTKAEKNYMRKSLSRMTTFDTTSDKDLRTSHSLGKKLKLW